MALRPVHAARRKSLCGTSNPYPARVKHPFRMIKRQFGHVKVRYGGLKKNTAQLVTVFALSSLWMVRGKWMGS